MPKRLTQKEDQTIFALNFHAGWTYNEIHDKFGYSNDAIRFSLKREMKRREFPVKEIGQEDVDLTLMVIRARLSAMSILKDPTHP